MMEHYSHVVPHSHMFDDYECIYQSELMTCYNIIQSKKLHAHIILMRVYHIEYVVASMHVTHPNQKAKSLAAVKMVTPTH